MIRTRNIAVHSMTVVLVLGWAILHYFDWIGGREQHLWYIHQMRRYDVALVLATVVWTLGALVLLPFRWRLSLVMILPIVTVALYVKQLAPERSLLYSTWTFPSP